MSIIARLNEVLAGRYRLEEEIGAGGMATVYLAIDLRHDRRVALKVLHPDLAAALGADRFLAEIRTTAKLQHPHILPLHDSGNVDGQLFYVMPLMEGETLRTRIEREQLLPLDDAVAIAREVLAALDYAHRHGVIHRDIKPENILLHDGTAIVADFGIAIAVSAASGPRMTQTGLSLGTPSYMSPEQAMGERVIDARADLYAVGATLYEMLVGEPPFTGPTAQAIVARVLTEEPRPLTAQRKLVPPNVDATVRRALQKLPADRFTSAAEMSAALVRADFTLPGTGPVGEATPAARAHRMRRYALDAAVVVAAAVAGMAAGAKWFAPPLPVPPAIRFSFEAFKHGSLPSALAISPDGSRIVFAGADSVGRTVLMLRSAGDERVAQIDGTRDAVRPVFSPDGRQIAFNQGGVVKRLSLDGGTASLVAAAPARALAWGRDGKITVVTGGAVLRLAPTGGAVDTILKSDSATGMFIDVTISRDDRALVLATRLLNGGSGAGTALYHLSIPERRLTKLFVSGLSPALTDDGVLTYSDLNGALFSAPMDLRRGTLGASRPVLQFIRLSAGEGFYADVAVSRNGSIVFSSSPEGGRSEVVLVDRAGRATAPPMPTGNYRSARFSRDGRRLAMSIATVGSSGDIWTYDIASQRQNRLTFDSLSLNPEWLPGGQFLTFTHRSRGPKVPVIDRIAADGGGAPAELLALSRPAYEIQFTPDGKRAVYRLDNGPTRRDVFWASADSLAAGHPLLVSAADEHMIALSPDGKWLAYVSDGSGRSVVYLRSADGTGGVWPISRGSGDAPRWGGSTRELLYRSGDSVFTVPLQLGTAVTVGQPSLLFTGHYSASVWDTFWDASPDGSRFVFIRPIVSAADRLTVIANGITPPAPR